MKKRITQADRLRWRMLFVTQQVLTVLGWDDGCEADYVFEMGLLFLRYYHSTDPEAMRLMWESKAFWDWWKLNWYFRDMEWMEGVSYRRSRGIEGLDETAYMSIHDAKALADVRTRWGRILEDSYCRDLAGSLK